MLFDLLHISDFRIEKSLKLGQLEQEFSCSELRFPNVLCVTVKGEIQVMNR